MYYGRTKLQQGRLRGETPFRLTFGSKVAIPIKIGLASLRVTSYNEYQNKEELKTNLDLIGEGRNEAQQRMAKYQGAMTRYYNRRVRVRRFNPSRPRTQKKYPRQLKIPHRESWDQTRKAHMRSSTPHDKEHITSGA